MAAYDYIDDFVHCERCACEHQIQIPVTFRLVDYWEMTTLRRGEWHPALDGTFDDINSAGWVRVRPEGSSSLCRLLEDNMFSCDHTAPLITLEVQSQQIRLVDIRYVHLSKALSNDAIVDFVSGSPFAHAGVSELELASMEYHLRWETFSRCLWV